MATLGFALTIAGRNSYTAGQDGLDKPGQLRKVNEIHHRVYACLRKLLVANGEPSFEGSIANWVLNQQDPELHELLVDAWKSTKDDLLREYPAS